MSRLVQKRRHTHEEKGEESLAPDALVWCCTMKKKLLGRRKSFFLSVSTVHLTLEALKSEGSLFYLLLSNEERWRYREWRTKLSFGQSTAPPVLVVHCSRIMSPCPHLYIARTVITSANMFALVSVDKSRVSCDSLSLSLFLSYYLCFALSYLLVYVSVTLHKPRWKGQLNKRTFVHWPAAQQRQAWKD